MSRAVILNYPAPGQPPDQPEYSGKFLQLTWRSQEYLIFAPAALHRYHNQLLGHFLEDNAVTHRWVTEQTLVVDDPALKVTGGGRFRVNSSRKILDLWDESQIYGRFDETELRAKITAAGHLWSGFDVRIS